MLVPEQKVRKKRARRDLTETPVQKTRRLRKEKLKSELKKNIKDPPTNGMIKHPVYKGISSIGDIIVFSFIGGLYRGQIVDITEETEWSPPLYVVQSGDTKYPIRPEKILGNESKSYVETRKRRIS